MFMRGLFLLFLGLYVTLKYMKDMKPFLTLIVAILAVVAFVFIEWGGYFDNQTNKTKQSETPAGLIRYENENTGFSFLYPDTMHLSEGDNVMLVSVSALSPGDPQRASDIGLFSTMNVRLFEGDVTVYIETVRQNAFTEQFVFSDMNMDSGATIPSIAYNNAFGARVRECFIDTGDGTVLLVSFVEDTPYADTFLKILHSFEW